jgi:hypothetical protein
MLAIDGNLHAETKRPLLNHFREQCLTFPGEGRCRVSNWKGFVQHVTTRSRETRLYLARSYLWPVPALSIQSGAYL